MAESFGILIGYFQVPNTVETLDDLYGLQYLVNVNTPGIDPDATDSFELIEEEDVPEPPASMYAYYSFEGTSVSGGTAWENKLDPGNNNLITTGTTDINNNVASNVNGRSGQVLYCPRNGSNNFFSGQFVPEPGDRTYTMWWCPETISTGGVVNQSLLINFNPSWNWDDNVWDWNGIPFAQESTVSLNNWYFIAVTQTVPGFQCNIWQGDVSTAPVKNSTTINSNFNDPIIGGFNGIFCINGWMDDVRIFDSILTDSEINDVWNLDK